MRYLPLLLIPSLAFGDPPPPEVRTTNVKVALPAVPKFDAPDESPRALQMATHPWGKVVLVRGYVIAIPRCPLLDTDPEKCERPKLFLGDTRTSSQESALWVVDYPRAPNKLERERLPKDELAKWPAVPNIAVGDYVKVTGLFTDTSTHHETNSDGLVMMYTIEKVSPSANAKRIAPDDETEPKQSPLAVPKPRAVAPQNKAEAEQALRDGNVALGMRQPDDAIAKYKHAIELWPDNDLAHYGLGGALMIKRNWVEARDAFAKAAALRPDSAMYMMWLGASRYESGQKTEAREPLMRAHQLEPKMWRPPYYLGRIARDAGHPRAAATYFTQAIENFPLEHGPYVALAELYRRWGLFAEAIKVGSEGMRNCIDGHNLLGFALGRAYEDAGQRDKAIEALTIASDVGNWQALLARARVKRAKGDKAGAKRDYEEVLAKAKDDASLVQIAQQALVELR